MSWRATCAFLMLPLSQKVCKLCACENSRTVSKQCFSRLRILMLASFFFSNYQRSGCSASTVVHFGSKLQNIVTTTAFSRVLGSSQLHHPTFMAYTVLTPKEQNQLVAAYVNVFARCQPGSTKDVRDYV